MLIAVCPHSPLQQNEVKARQEVEDIYETQEKMYMTEQLGQVHASLRALNLAENIRLRNFNLAEKARISEDEKNMADVEKDRAADEGREANISFYGKALFKKRQEYGKLQVCSTI